MILGMNGVWLSFLASEVITLIMVLILARHKKAGKRMHTFDILLQQIGLFIIYILAGVILVRTRVLSRETLEPISKFVLKMALPVRFLSTLQMG